MAFFWGSETAQRLSAAWSPAGTSRQPTQRAGRPLFDNDFSANVFAKSAGCRLCRGSAATPPNSRLRFRSHGAGPFKRNSALIASDASTNIDAGHQSRDDMAYFPDLSPYTYRPNRSPALNVGWLDPGRSYPQGQVRMEFVQRLRELCVTQPVNQTRGFHQCGFCAASGQGNDIIAQWQDCVRKMGSAEIWVVSPTGVTFAAPDLILYYVEAHQYLPPADLIATVITR